ncbi:MAG: hydrolase [Prolixibacteraceae bacterium]
MRIKREECTALIIDIQEKLYPVMAEKEALVTNCIKLLQGFAALNIPTIFSQQYTKGLGATIPEISSLYPSFSYIEKQSFSCMDEPDCVHLLEQTGKSIVLICGIESHVCVLQTAIDLQEKGYQPVVISDCISSRNLTEKQIALNRFSQEGIRISTVESILFELTRSASAAEFKAISKIIK